jgi:hypothetical protein
VGMNLIFESFSKLPADFINEALNICALYYIKGALKMRIRITKFQLSFSKITNLKIFVTLKMFKRRTVQNLLN